MIRSARRAGRLGLAGLALLLPAGLALLLPAGLALLLPAGLAAQENPAPDSLPRYLLEGVTVTTPRAPVRREAVPQNVRVLTRRDVERTPASGVADLLKKTAGLDVIQYPGLLAGVSIRGFRPQYSGGAQRTLVLLDGRPAGLTNLATLDLSAVERIEVLKGPASALYGSNAMGGVVNVVTRRSSGEVHGGVSAGYGSFDTHRAELRAGGGLTRALDFDLSLASQGRGSGYRIGSSRLLGGDSLTKTLLDGTTVRLPQFSRDTTLAFSEYGYRTASVRLGYALSPGWRVDARAGAFAADRVQNPGDLGAPYPTLNDLARRTAELGAAGQLGRHALSLRGFGSRERTDYYDDALHPSYHSSLSTSRWTGAQLQDVVAFGPHSLTAGLDYTAAETETERYTGPGSAAPLYAPNSAIRSAAGFAQARLAWLDERLTATLGARLDRIAFDVHAAELYDRSRVAANRETHLALNPSAGVQYTAPGGVRVHGTAGRAFVTPDPFSVAGYSESRTGEHSVAVTRGNPDLAPESSTTWDAGLGFVRPARGLEADITYFRTAVRNRIARQAPLPGGGALTPAGDTIRSVVGFANADRARIRGLEASLAYDLGALAGFRYSARIFASATRLLTAEETTGALTAGIKNVADLTLGYGVEYDDLKRFGARLTGRYVGERLDADFVDWQNPGELRYPAFMVLDLSTDLRLARRYRLGLAVDNLADENYYEVRGYNLPGRAFRVSLGANF